MADAFDELTEFAGTLELQNAHMEAALRRIAAASITEVRPSRADLIIWARDAIAETFPTPRAEEANDAA